MFGKIVLLALGGLLTVLGLGALAAGTLIFVVSDGHGFLRTGLHPYTTPTRALVSTRSQLTNDGDGVGSWHSFRFRVDAQAGAGKAVFVGIGPTADVDRYLAGVGTDEVTHLSFKPYHLTTVRHAGSAVPTPPGGQPSWIVKAAGTGGLQLDWKLARGSYELVIMNTDGSPGVDAGAKIAVQVPHLRAVGLGCLIGGIALVVIGVLLLIAGIRRRTGPPRAFEVADPGQPAVTEP